MSFGRFICRHSTFRKAPDVNNQDMKEQFRHEVPKMLKAEVR